jgi:hypothetical protein
LANYDLTANLKLFSFRAKIITKIANRTSSFEQLCFIATAFPALRGKKYVYKAKENPEKQGKLEQKV